LATANRNRQGQSAAGASIGCPLVQYGTNTDIER